MIELSSNKSLSLGPLPWSNEILIAAVWSSPSDAQRFVDEHPGRDLEKQTNSLKDTLRIFNKAVTSFFECLERFQAEVKGGQLFRRNRQADFIEYEAGFQEIIFLFASSAKMLVEQSRTLNNEINLSGYSERTAGFATDPRHRFIQELRNDLIHIVLHQPKWQIATDRNRETTSRFLLWPDQLKIDKYNKFARLYVDQHTKGIDLSELIKSCSADINEFHRWLHKSIENSAAGEQIADYRRCVRCIKSVSSRSEWNVIFQQFVLPSKIDPYQYLDQYLTTDELNEINKLPFQSKAQVDRIISLVDEYDACDNNLRLLIYKAFRAYL